jgi:hypothetical protein
MPAPEAWPFRPMTGVSSETLEWSTDVLNGYTGEQRLALREYPRQIFRYAAKLEPASFAKARVLARRLAGSEIGAPVWIEAVYVGAIASAATSITVDTTAADFRVDGYAFVWQDDDTYATVETSAVASGSLTLTGAVGTEFTRAWVMPLRTARAVEGFTISRAATTSDIAATLQVIDNAYLGASPSTTYLSIGVVTDPPVAVADISESIIQAIDYVDNGFGLIYAEPIEDHVRGGFTISYADENTSSLWTRRQWLHALRGRQGAFWLPSFNADLTLQSPIGVGGTSTVVASVGPEAFYADKHIMIETTGGTRYFRKINSASAGSGTDTLTLDSAIGPGLATADVERICFMARCRLDADSVTIAYRYISATAISIPVVEVPE